MTENLLSLTFQLRFFFDPGSAVCLWPADSATAAALGHAIELESLPLSAQAIALGNLLLERFDTSLDWNDPGGPSPWSASERVEFHMQAREFLAVLRAELGPTVLITDELKA